MLSMEKCDAAFAQGGEKNLLAQGTQVKTFMLPCIVGKLGTAFHATNCLGRVVLPPLLFSVQTHGYLGEAYARANQQCRVRTLRWR